MCSTRTRHHLKSRENCNNAYSMVRVKCVFCFTTWLCFKRNMYSSAICGKQTCHRVEFAFVETHLNKSQSQTPSSPSAVSSLEMSVAGTVLYLLCVCSFFELTCTKRRVLEGLVFITQLYERDHANNQFTRRFKFSNFGGWHERIEMGWDGLCQCVFLESYIWRKYFVS